MTVLMGELMWRWSNRLSLRRRKSLQQNMTVLIPAPLMESILGNSSPCHLRGHRIDARAFWIDGYEAPAVGERYWQNNSAEVAL
mgnify:CR=1 FL=1